VAKLSDHCNRIAVLSLAALLIMAVAGLHALVFLPAGILAIRVYTASRRRFLRRWATHRLRTPYRPNVFLKTSVIFPSATH